MFIKTELYMKGSGRIMVESSVCMAKEKKFLEIEQHILVSGKME